MSIPSLPDENYIQQSSLAQDIFHLQKTTNNSAHLTSDEKTNIQNCLSKALADLKSLRLILPFTGKVRLFFHKPIYLKTDEFSTTLHRCNEYIASALSKSEERGLNWTSHNNLQKDLKMLRLFEAHNQIIQQGLKYVASDPNLYTYFIEDINTANSWAWNLCAKKPLNDLESSGIKLLTNNLDRIKDIKHPLISLFTTKLHENTNTKVLGLFLLFNNCYLPTSLRKDLHANIKTEDIFNINPTLFTNLLCILSTNPNLNFLPKFDISLLSILNPVLIGHEENFLVNFTSTQECIDKFLKPRDISDEIKNVGIHYTSDSRLEYTAKILQLQRLYELYHFVLGPTLEPHAQDCTISPTSFPKTQAIFLGNGNTLEPLLNQLPTMLNPYDISIYSYPSDRESLPVNVLSRPCKYPPIQWVQDSSFFTETNLLHLPKLVLDADDKIPPILYKRLKANYPGIQEDYPTNYRFTKTPFYGSQGAVGHEAQLSMLSQMLAWGSLFKAKINLSYNEGGNTLIGEDKNGKFVIIGQDTVEITKQLLIDELSSINNPLTWKRCWSNDRIDISEKDLKELFAQDYGIPSDRIYFIEQPGDFHLDMQMAILNEKTILLNDSMASAKYSIEKSLKNVTELNRAVYEKNCTLLLTQAEKQVHLQNIAAQNLESHGFSVIRIAGTFCDLEYINPNNTRSNFFNFISITTPNDKKCIVALGCSSDLQSLFKTIIAENFSPATDILFLDEQTSKKALSLQGGIRCLTKTLPNPLY